MSYYRSTEHLRLGTCFMCLSRDEDIYSNRICGV
jgi:hypothetical protein